MIIKVVTYIFIFSFTALIVLGLILAFNVWCEIAMKIMQHRCAKLSYAREQYEKEHRGNSELITPWEHFLKETEADWELLGYRELCTNRHDYMLIRPYLTKIIRRKRK